MTPLQQRLPVAAWLGGMTTGAGRGVRARWCRRATVVEGARVRCMIGGREAGMAGMAWEERLAVACVQGGGERVSWRQGGYGRRGMGGNVLLGLGPPRLEVVQLQGRPLLRQRLLMLQRRLLQTLPPAGTWCRGLHVCVMV